MSRYFPRPGDAVEDWLTSFRDLHAEGSQAWVAIDDLIEDYAATAEDGEPLLPWNEEDA